jgi:hypothetical protein
MKYEFGSTGKMAATGENGSTWRKTGLNATLSTINPTWTVLGSNAGHCDDWPTNNQPPIFWRSIQLWGR